MATPIATTRQTNSSLLSQISATCQSLVAVALLGFTLASDAVRWRLAHLSHS
jgi:hypothetical protein